MEKPDPYRPSLPHVVIINGFQVLQSSIICLPSYPIGRRYLPYSSPYPVYVPHSISKWHARPLFHSLYPGYNSGLEYSVQCQFSLELARCSNSISHSNKLYFPLILSHVWKFFSNLCPDHDNPAYLIYMQSTSCEMNSQMDWNAYINHLCTLHFIMRSF